MFKDSNLLTTMSDTETTLRSGKARPAEVPPRVNRKNSQTSTVSGSSSQNDLPKGDEVGATGNHPKTNILEDLVDPRRADDEPQDALGAKPKVRRDAFNESLILAAHGGSPLTRRG